MKYFKTSFKQAIPKVSQSNWSDLESWGRGGGQHIFDWHKDYTNTFQNEIHKQSDADYVFCFVVTAFPLWKVDNKPILTLTTIVHCSTTVLKLTMWATFFTINVEVMSWPFAFYLFSRHYGNKPTWPMLILNLFESHKVFAPFLKLAAFEPDDASLWHQFSAVGEIWFSTQTRGQIYISYSLKPKTWKKWAHQNTVYLLLNVPLLTYREKTEISIANLKTEEKWSYY